MPMMQAFVERVNTRFNRTNIDSVDASLLSPGNNLADAATRSTQGAGAIRGTAAEAQYITNNFSVADLDKLREILHWAVTQETRVPVQFLWVPGPDASIEYWHVAAQEGSKPGISVLLHGPTTSSVTPNRVPK